MIEQKTTTVKELAKSQNVRLFDIFILGPLMIYAGVKYPHPVNKIVALAGVGTIIYNLNNYLANRRTNPWPLQ